MANLSLNPMATTNALGSFGVQSDGYIQGVALDDPANRFNGGGHRGGNGKQTSLGRSASC